MSFKSKLIALGILILVICGIWWFLNQDKAQPAEKYDNLANLIGDKDDGGIDDPPTPKPVDPVLNDDTDNRNELVEQPANADFDIPENDDDGTDEDEEVPVVSNVSVKPAKDSEAAASA